jgi:hypothetical protein
MNIVDFKRAAIAQQGKAGVKGFWVFNSITSTLNNFKITTSDSSPTVIVWGDNTTSTTAVSNVSTSHNYVV